MKNKGFTLVEMVIVIAILAIISLIGVVAYSKIQERSAIKADKLTAAQIGKSLLIRESVVDEEKKIGYYPTITIYDQLEGIEEYIAKEIRPQSMKDGYFVTTAIQTETGKKIIVGVGRPGDKIIDKPYTNSKEPGWAWSEEIEINKFLEEYKEKMSGEGIIPNAPISPNEPSNSLNDIQVGAYIAYDPVYVENGNEVKEIIISRDDTGANAEQSFSLSDYDKGWKVLYNDGNQLVIISAESVGNLTLGTKSIGTIRNETDSRLNGGKTGYAKVIYTLNKISNGYANGKYAVAGKSLGIGESNGDNEIIDVSSISHQNFWKLKDEGSLVSPHFPYSDQYNKTETSLIEKTSLLHSSQDVWLASRNVGPSRSSTDFRVYYQASSGTVKSYSLYCGDYRNETYYAQASEHSNGVRPIIILESGLKVESGDGLTLKTAYVVSK